MSKTRLGGVALAVDDEQPTFWARAEAGTWEPGTLRVLGGLVGPGTTFLDIGAWVGPLSLFAAARGARVLAFEPDPVAASQFRRNVAANPALASRITLIEAALSTGPDPVRLGARRKRGDSMSSVLLAEGADSWNAEAITPAAVLDRLRSLRRRHAEEHPQGASRSTHDRGASFETAAPRLPQDDEVGCVRPNSETSVQVSDLLVDGQDHESFVVKIDIEGGEYALLPHLAPLIGAVDALLVSFHRRFLTEAGTSDPVAALRDALVPLAGWIASPIEGDGEGASGIVPGALIGRPDHETWLFRPSASPALGRPGASR